ncbi:response regulator transcription factor [Cohnella mopanensis]|uniref:response regulator transcription factor n=1 Tax=Cohnella mopanensis TaxID=2911966 RepID=UPI001EF89901|nr:response regulator [Cohnella mopanensis]
MMNVILADDERLVRSSLRSMLEEMNIPIQVVGEAGNGDELLQLLQTSSPDLIFVDIRMPRMDGLEAIRQGKPYAPDASWVIVTGFSEFNYAQEAVRLGASNYLLKPAEPEELEKCVRKAIQEQHKTAYYLNCEFEHWMTKQLRKSSSEGSHSSDQNNLSYNDHSFAGITLISNRPSSDIIASDQLQQLAQDVQRAIVQQAEFKDVRSAILSLRNGSLSIFCALPRAGATKDEQLHASIERQSLSLANKSEGLSLYALRTNLCEDFTALFNELEELQALSSLRMFFPPRSSALTLDTLRSESVKTNAIAIGDNLVQLVDSYNTKDYVGYQQKISALKKQDSRALFENAVFKNVCHFLTVAINVNIHAAMTPMEWYDSLLHKGDDLLSAPDGSPITDKTDIIQRVIAYVDNSFMKEIAIGALASEFNVTPNYLSTLFHKRNGVTFVKYLTNIRMLKAKELLLTKPELKVQDVAQAVGYFSSRHFTKLFQEHFKCYPSEIREKNG